MPRLAQHQVVAATAWCRATQARREQAAYIINVVAIPLGARHVVAAGRLAADAIAAAALLGALFASRLAFLPTAPTTELSTAASGDADAPCSAIARQRLAVSATDLPVPMFSMVIRLYATISDTVGSYGGRKALGKRASISSSMSAADLAASALERRSPTPCLSAAVAASASSAAASLLS